MAYDGRWTSTDQIPQRAVDAGTDRPLRHARRDGRRRSRIATAARSSGSGREGNAATKVTAYGIALRPRPVLELHVLPRRSGATAISSSRPITASSAARRSRTVGSARGSADRCRTRWARRCDTTPSRRSASTTRSRATRLETTREDDVRQTSVGGLRAERDQWTPWLRTLAGVRVDGYRFDVDARDPRNSGTDTAGLVSPKGGVILGPWAGTELYVNAGLGFHSNDARGATITVDPVDRGSGRSRDAARARPRRRGRPPHRSRPAPAVERGAVDAEPRLGTGLRRRRGDDRGRASEPPLWRRVGQLLRPSALAQLRRRRRDLPGALHGRRSRGLADSRGRRRPCCRQAPRSITSTGSSGACAGATSARARSSRMAAWSRPPRVSPTCRWVTGSRRRCGSR